MPYYATCPECDELTEVEATHNGVCPCWHTVHCGWGQDSFGCEPFYAVSYLEAKAMHDSISPADETKED